LMISCGCALFNARVALAAAGYGTNIERFPDVGRPDLLVRAQLGSAGAGDGAIAGLDAAIDARRTNRRRFSDEQVPSSLIDELMVIATAEGADLVHINQPDDRLALARLSQHADELENIDPAYRAELRAWTSDDPNRLDGVPAMSVPHVDGGAHDELPIRDFDTHGHGWLPVETHSTSQQCLLLLGTAQDTPLAWLRAGEALEHILLELTRRGYSASPLTQVIEVATTNEMLRHELRLTMHPHVLLRVGRAPLAAASRRRRLGDMLIESAARPPL
jgi:hypothetical protein